MRVMFGVAFLMLGLTGCMDMMVNTSYQRAHMPEIVNATREAVDVILVFKHSPDESRRLYHTRVPVHDSLPVWLDNHRGPSYLVGSSQNIVEEVLAVRAGICSELLARYRDERNGMYDTSLSREDLADFLIQCPSIVKVSGKELEKIRRQSAFYPEDATCLMLNDDGTLTPVRESELPWYGSPLDNDDGQHLLSICAEPNVPEKEPLFQRNPH